jgi:hypothetical protein
MLKMFKTEKIALGNLAAVAAAELIVAAAGILLIIDKRGVIHDGAFGRDDLYAHIQGEWLGRAWLDTVTLESGPKVLAMLRELEPKTAGRSREVNPPAARGADVPILCSAIQVGRQRRVVVLGRELRTIEALA